MATATAAPSKDTALNPDYANVINKLFSNIAAPTNTTTKGDTAQLKELINTVSNLSTPAGASALIQQIFKEGNKKYSPGISNQVVSSGGRAGKSSYQALASSNLQAGLSGQAAEALNRNAATAIQGAGVLAQTDRSGSSSPDIGSLLAIAGIETGIHAGADKLYSLYKGGEAAATATGAATGAATNAAGVAIVPDFAPLTASATTAAATDVGVVSAASTGAETAALQAAVAGDAVTAGATDAAITGGAAAGAEGTSLMSTLGTYALPIGATIAALYAIDKYTGLGKDAEKLGQHVIQGAQDLGHGIENAVSGVNNEVKKIFGW